MVRAPETGPQWSQPVAHHPGSPRGRHVEPGRCHIVPADAPGIRNATDVTTSRAELAHAAIGAANVNAVPPSGCTLGVPLFRRRDIQKLRTCDGRSIYFRASPEWAIIQARSTPRDMGATVPFPVRAPSAAAVRMFISPCQELSDVRELNSVTYIKGDAIDLGSVRRPPSVRLMSSATHTSRSPWPTHGPRGDP